MDAVTYPETKVINFLSKNFIPVRCHVGENKTLPERFNVHWTPTLVVANAQGTIHHSITSFMPPDELVSQLEFALAKASFDKGDYQASFQGFNSVVEKYPKNIIAPEALYWSAVSEYKLKHSSEALMNGWKRLMKEYPDSDWTKKLKFFLEGEQ